MSVPQRKGLVAVPLVYSPFRTTASIMGIAPRLGVLLESHGVRRGIRRSIHDMTLEDGLMI